MGWFDGASEIGSTSHSHHKSSSSSHKHEKREHKSSPPRASSIFGLAVPDGGGERRSQSRSRSESGRSHGHLHSHGGHSHREDKGEEARDKMRSIFGTGDGPKRNESRGSFFGGFSAPRSSSHYKRSSRPGYYKRIYTKLRRLLRDLVYYMKKNPMKVFMLVIMPLITGGALTTLLAKFGVRLPPSVVKMFGGNQAGGGGGGFGGRGYGGGRGGGGEWSRSHTEVEGPLGMMGGLGGLASMVGGMGGIGGAISLAKMFM